MLSVIMSLISGTSASPRPAYDPVLSLLAKYPSYSSYIVSRCVYVVYYLLIVKYVHVVHVIIVNVIAKEMAECQMSVEEDMTQQSTQL